MLEKSLTINKSFGYMTLERMGSRYPSRLSFSRSMLRRMEQEKWVVDRVKFDLDKDGYGTAIYEINTPNQIYSVVCFSQFIPDEERSDRVIAEKWDTAYAMHIGKLSAKDLDRLKKNTPLQEAGRNTPRELVLSRGNKSVRLFKKIVNCLSIGQQPTIEEINDVGYLLRTTAVYGSGKFGLSDFDRTRSTTHFDQPFRAEMLAVYIIREFSIHLVEHIAYHLNPSQATKLDASIKRHIGIGNSTGLGMAPFIIKHPKLIHKWMSQFEKSLNEIKKIKHIDERKLNKLSFLLKKSKSYLDEVLTTDDYQKTKNKKSFYELDKIIDYCKSIKTSDLKDTRWNDIIKYSEENLSFDAQEIVKVQIIELFPEIADPLAEDMSESDDLFIDASATVNELLNIIESRYKWSIDTDFQNKHNTYLFWYVSEGKLEPRLGERYNEQGAELEQHLGIGKMVSDLYHFLKENSAETKNLTIAKFLLIHPEYRGIIRRIQTLTNYPFGEVSDNILAKNTLPLNMLRFKLSFFGASRYDPKSDRWLRVSFFAGAPFYEELNAQNVEDWGFATMNSYQ